MTQARRPIRIERQRDGTFRLTAELLVHDKAERLFQFLSVTDNLDVIVPPSLKLRRLTQGPIAMGVGTHIDYRLRIHGVPARWETDITAWEPPRRFAYAQRRGPFRHWVHEHTLLDRNGRTLLRDDVHYAVPGGRLVHNLFVRRDVERLFLYRQEQLVRIFSPRQ